MHDRATKGSIQIIGAEVGGARFHRAWHVGNVPHSRSARINDWPILSGFAVLLLVLASLRFAPAGHGADLDLHKLFHESIPDSPFIGVVYGYADAMLEHGRDTYGPKKTGMLLSALDRKTLLPLDTRPPPPAGVSSASRPGAVAKPLVGANAQMDQNLLRLLYFLKGLSGEDRYPQAADAELKWLLTGAQSPNSSLLPWGEHLSWDVMTDMVASGTERSRHEFSRPWMLWDRCFELAPQQSKRFAMGLWNHHVVDQKTGGVRPSVDFDANGSQPAEDCPRHAGYFIRTWAEAFAHTGDEVFLSAIETVLSVYEKKQRRPAQPAGHSSGSPNVCDALSLAIDCDGAARKVPEPLRTRLTAFAACEDARFCALPHELREKHGFVKSRDATASHVTYTSLWDPMLGKHTTAAVGVMCRSRYENTGRIGYRKLTVAAADAYLDSLPGDDIDAWPLSFGQAITVELAAWRITARKKYFARASELGEIAIEKYFGDSPLPRASLKTDHYESTTGADTLALALAELHLSTRTITVVRTPPNTIDR